MLTVKLPSSAAAALLAQQLVANVNSSVKQITTAIEAGVPVNQARPTFPAVSAEEIKAALGLEVVAAVTAAAAALN